MANSPPSYEDFFQATKDSYMQDGNPDFKPTGDLTLIAQDNSDIGDGCYAAVYRVGTSDEVIVAIEGTSPEYLNPANFNPQQNIYSTASLGADAVLAKDAFTGTYTIPKCFVDAQNYVQKIIASQNLSPSNVYVTGHSLGASEAEYVFANTVGLGGGVGFAGTGVPNYTGGMDTNTGFTNYLEYGDPVDNLASDSTAGSAFGITNDNHVGLLNWRGNVSDQEIFTEDFGELNALNQEIVADGPNTSIGHMLQLEKFAVNARFVFDFVSNLHFHDLSNYEVGPPLPHALEVDLTAQFPDLQNLSVTTDASGAISESGTLSLGSSGNNEAIQQTSFQDGSMRTLFSATIGGETYSASNMQSYGGMTLSEAVTFNGDNVVVGGSGAVGLAATADGMPVVSVVDAQSNLAIDIAMEAASGGATPDIDISAIDLSANTANTVAAFSADDMADQTLSVTVTESGTATVLSVIDSGATFEALPTGKAAGVTVGFALSKASTLKISQLSSFTATVDGFSVDNKIDLAGQTVSGLALGSGNSLNVTTGSGQSTIQLDPAQNFRADTFDAGADGSGGTDIRVTSLVGIDTSGQIIKVDPANGMTTALSSTKIATFAVGGEAAVADKLYVATGGMLDTVDLQTGAVTGTASTATNFVADNATGVLVGAAGGIGESFSSSGFEILAPTGIQSIDPSTGATHQLATIPGLLGIYVSAETARDGKLYFSGQTATGTQLYTMDVATGAYSSVSTQATNFFADASTGNLVGVGDGKVYKVDPTTGSETVIASIAGLSALSTSGEAAQGGYLYFDGFITASGNDPQQERSFIVNETTGEYTSIAGSTPNIVSNEPITPLCFAEGTLIATRGGDIAVEDLAVGDFVETVSGSFRAIRWLGHRVIAGVDNAFALDASPIRVVAHAFGVCRPTRDLYLSPGHPVLVGADKDGRGGYLVPIMCLINGTTIARAKVDSVTYWHVELDAHDILLAEGLPAESYLDWGDRGFFSEAAQHALVNPDFIVPGLGGRCRPVTIDGPVVEAERRRLDCLFAERLAAPCAWPDASITAYL